MDIAIPAIGIAMLVGAGTAEAMAGTAMEDTAMVGMGMVAPPSTSAWEFHCSMAATMEAHIPTMTATIVTRDTIAATTGTRGIMAAIMAGLGLVCGKETEARPH